jgi:hypothetical protein
MIVALDWFDVLILRRSCSSISPQTFVIPKHLASSGRKSVGRACRSKCEVASVQIVSHQS